MCGLPLTKGNCVSEWCTATDDSTGRFHIGTVINQYVENSNVVGAGSPV